MVGIWKSYADIYLIVAGIGMLISFGIPLLVVPLRWAKLFRWEIPERTNLAVFLGRSLGVLISLLAVFAIRVTFVPEAKPFYFDLMLSLFVVMIALHVYGALRRIQPRTETVEILLWIILFVISLCFYPV